MYPPKQGIKTLINNDIIKIRCTFSGERAQSVTSSFQSFPITNENFDRLEPFSYNEYEMQIDFSGLSIPQKSAVNLIDMEFNIVAAFTSLTVPFEEPKLIKIASDTIITVLDREIMNITSDTFVILVIDINTTSDTTIFRAGFAMIDTTSDTTIV